MGNTRFLKITIITLLLINIGTLVFIWTSKPHHGPPGDGPRTGGPGSAAEFLVKELKFDEKQQKLFTEMHEKHHERVRLIQEKNNELHHRFFDLLKTAPIDTIAATALADSMSMCQKRIEMLTFQHFKMVREICSAEQQQRFGEVINEALRIMAPKRGPR